MSNEKGFLWFIYRFGFRIGEQNAGSTRIKCIKVQVNNIQKQLGMPVIYQERSHIENIRFSQVILPGLVIANLQ